MARNIFSQKEVGNFYNDHFLCASVQLDKTQQDDQLVRNWYADADSLHQQYGINAYPTLLFFAPDGTLVHRISGGSTDGADFIAKGKEALSPVTQNYAGISHWQDHVTDTAFLWKIYQKALSANDRGHAKVIGEAYLDAQQDFYTKRNLRLVVACGLLSSSKSRWFQLFLSNARRIDDSVDGIGEKGQFVAFALRPAVFNEAIDSARAKGGPIYWQAIKKEMKRKYGFLGNQFPRCHSRRLFNSK